MKSSRVVLSRRASSKVAATKKASSKVAKNRSLFWETVFKPHGLTESWVTFVLWIISISIDPLILYLPAINNDNKSIEINNILAVSLFVLLLFLQSFGFAGKRAYILTTTGFMLQCLFVNTMMKQGDTVNAILVNSFLVMYSWRVYGIYGLFTYKITRTYVFEEAKTIIIKIVLNFALYLYGGYVFGGIWYLMAIRKKTECWLNACKNHGGCHFEATFGFIVTSRNTTFLDHNCPKILKTEDTTKYDELGMFKDAFELGTLESKNLPSKLLLCFRWGLQNLSGLGQSLPYSARAAENIFAIFIIIYGVVMFTYFLGNVQMYIQYATSVSQKRRREEEEEQWEEIKKWAPFRELSDNLRNEIKEKQKYSEVQTVNLINLLWNVPENVGYKIKQELCMSVIREIDRFLSWRVESLRSLCRCVKPVIYDTFEVQEGDPVEMMCFVVQGNVTGHNHAGTYYNNLKFWGEELFGWADQSESSHLDSDAQSESNMPPSNKTIRAYSTIETFVLSARDFKRLYDDESACVRETVRSHNGDGLISRNARGFVQRPTPPVEFHMEAEIVEEEYIDH